MHACFYTCSTLILHFFYTFSTRVGRRFLGARFFYTGSTLFLHSFRISPTDEILAQVFYTFSTLVGRRFLDAHFFYTCSTLGGRRFLDGSAQSNSKRTGPLS